MPSRSDARTRRRAALRRVSIASAQAADRTSRTLPGTCRSSAGTILRPSYVPDWQPRRDAVHEGGVRRCQHAQAQPRDAERLADALNYREIGMALEVVATQETAPRPAIYKVHERLIEDQDGPECSQGV